MTSDYDALLRGVLTYPDDDLRRLVLADCLEENGQGDRAEFVRLQVGAGDSRPCGCSCGGPECRNCRLAGADAGRQSELLAANESPWSRPWRTKAAVRNLQTSVDSCCNRHADRMGCDCLKDAPDFTWSRGFVSEVTLTLAQFVGGTCKGCDVGPGVRRYATHGGDWTEGDCNECRGTGRVAGCAEALFRSQPVTRVVLSDREPMLGSRGRNAAGSLIQAFAWVVEGVPTGQPTGVRPENTIPCALADVLPGGAGVVGRDFVYPTSQAATDALFNVAAVAYGRRLAGLDPTPKE